VERALHGGACPIVDDEDEPLRHRIVELANIDALRRGLDDRAMPLCTGAFAGPRVDARSVMVAAALGSAPTRVEDQLIARRATMNDTRMISREL
jgi:hypothetical protein